jgi:hypothetical protein
MHETHGFTTYETVVFNNVRSPRKRHDDLVDLHLVLGEDERVGHLRLGRKVDESLARSGVDLVLGTAKQDGLDEEVQPLGGCGGRVLNETLPNLEGKRRSDHSNNLDIEQNQDDDDFNFKDDELSFTPHFVAISNINYFKLSCSLLR